MISACLKTEPSVAQFLIAACFSFRCLIIPNQLARKQERDDEMDG